MPGRGIRIQAVVQPKDPIMAVYPTVAETSRKLKAAHFSLTVKVMHNGRYLAEAVPARPGDRRPTGEGSTPDGAAFMALVLLEADPDTYTSRLAFPQRPVTVQRLSILPPVDLPTAW
jgi:hypothetical protein